MSEGFPHVFEPIRLRHKTLTSRITLGAHTANMAEDGLPGERPFQQIGDAVAPRRARLAFYEGRELARRL